MNNSFVVGYAFSDPPDSVVMVLKKRPTWQAGKLNGVGGRIEKGENATDAMVREFAEEAGLKLRDWNLYCVLHGGDTKVAFFRIFSNSVFAARTMTDEPIVLCSPRWLPANCISNSHWLVPLALDRSLVTPIVLWDSNIDGGKKIE